MNDGEMWGGTDYELKTLIGRQDEHEETAIKVMFEVVSHVFAEAKVTELLVLTAKVMSTEWLYINNFVMITCLNDIPIPVKYMTDKEITIGELYEKIADNRKYTEKGMRFYILPEDR